ncbi:alpha/beta fold hydrolase [Hymenobacter coccineus]|uniref:alpha/beta fold hydrolase n=1 Tax=Hymenobacter coccineus TaxID=1908235 RepID=UPI0009F402C3|nr:alpha/beta fold hydrolase [Hymenobacter coccineus]
MAAPLTTAPTLVFLHGFAESREVWTDFTRSFPAGYRLLAPNLPGHGTNRAPVPDFSMEAQARYVAQYLTDKGAADPVLLVAHSMGGYVALALAERYPSRVAGLALINSTALPDTDEKRQNREKNIGFVERHGVEKFMDSFVRPLFAPANRDRLVEARELLEEIGKATPATTFAGALRGMAARPTAPLCWPAPPSQCCWWPASTTWPCPSTTRCARPRCPPPPPPCFWKAAATWPTWSSPRKPAAPCWPWPPPCSRSSAGALLHSEGNRQHVVHAHRLAAQQRRCSGGRQRLRHP